MTPDEVRMLDNRYALLFIRGERPVQDEKFDILRHPFVGDTTDGNGKPYVHGADYRSAAALQLIGSKAQEQPTEEPKPDKAKNSNQPNEPENTFALYTEEDLEELFNEEKTKTEEETNEHEKPQQSVLQISKLHKKPKPADGAAQASAVYPKPRWQQRV